MHLYWNAYGITGMLTAAFTLIMGIFVYLQKKNSPTNFAFLIFSLAISEWSFFSALHAMVNNPQLSLLFSKICHVGALFIAVFFYYFTQKIIGKSFRASTIAGFLLGILLVIINFKTSLFISGTRTDVGVLYFAKAGPWYWVIVFFFSFYVLLSGFYMLKEIRISHGTRKKHIQYFFYSSLISFSVGYFNFLPLYGSTMPPYPYSAICGAIYAGIVAYAIAQHKLFDIEIFIKKGVIFGLLFTITYATVSLLIFFIGYGKTFIPPALLFSLSIALAMLIYEPLKKLLSNLTHDFLYQRKMAYVELIENVTDHLAEIRDTKIISKEIVNFLSEKMALQSAYLFLKENGPDFHLSSYKGPHIPFHELGLNKRIQALMTKNKTPLVISPFDTESVIDKETKADLRRLHFEMIVPIYIDNELDGIILIGQKKSDEAFTKEDEALLKTLMEEADMLFISSKLLKDLNRTNLELGQKKKMSSLIQLSKGIHHELRNPLHAVSVLSSHILDNAMKYHTEDAALLKSDTQEMLGEIDRIKNCLRRFTEFARPSNVSDMKPLYLREELDNFFMLMMEGQKTDNIKVTNNVDEMLSILANKSGFQEILFNLFNNAFDAMQGKGTIILNADEANDFVVLTFTDSGAGIPENILPHIFDDYFTTKTGTEAAGIGLSIVKHRMELFGGEIMAGSMTDGGAQFTLKLRKNTEENKAA